MRPVWLNGSDTKPPIFLELRSSKPFIISSVAAAVFTDIFLYGIVVPVLPFALTSRAGIASDDVQTWVSILLAVYGAALLAASPFAGFFADHSTTRRFPLILGLLALGGSTVMLTVGSSIAVFVVGRILQGISAAVVWCVGLALLVDTVGSDDIGVAMGYVGIAMSLGVLLAPLLGGIVFDRAGYDAVFAMAYALIGVDIVLRLGLVEKRTAMKWRKEENLQAAAAVSDNIPRKMDTSVVDMVLPTASEEPQKQPEKQAISTEKEECDALTIKIQESQAETTVGSEPQPPTSQDAKVTSRLPVLILLLSSRRLCAALWGCLIQATLLTSFDSTLPLYVNQIWGWNSLGAGLIFIPIMIPTFIGPFVGSLSDKYGARWLATAGFICATPVLILLRLVTYDSMRQKVLFCALLCLVGVTLDLVLTPLMAEITYAIEATAAKRPKGFLGEKGAYAQAYALFNMAFAGGCMVGPLVGGLINERAGWGATTLTLGCLSAISAVPTLIWTGGSLFRQKRRKEGCRVTSSAACLAP